MVAPFMVEPGSRPWNGFGTCCDRNASFAASRVREVERNSTGMPFELTHHRQVASARSHVDELHYEAGAQVALDARLPARVVRRLRARKARWCPSVRPSWLASPGADPGGWMSVPLGSGLLSVGPRNVAPLLSVEMMPRRLREARLVAGVEVVVGS